MHSFIPGMEGYGRSYFPERLGLSAINIYTKRMLSMSNTASRGDLGY